MWKSLLNCFKFRGTPVQPEQPYNPSISTPPPIPKQPTPKEELLVINYEYDGTLPSRKRKKPPTAIVTHHTVTKTAKSTRKVLKDRNLSTHYEIDQAGICYQYLNPATKVASHVGTYNEQSIGIDLTHMTGLPFPDLQMKTWAKLVKHLCKEFNISLTVAPITTLYYKTQPILPVEEYGIYGHSNLASTRCPDGAPMIEYLNSVD